MELRHLRYFAVVARTEHFGRAAQALGIAQPALSRQIKQLEDEIGAELLERLPRGVRLTVAGRAYAAEVAAILTQVDAANKKARDFASGNIGSVSVGFNDVASWHDSIPHRINAFRRAFPDITLELLPLSSAAQIRALHEGKLDAGIVYDVHCTADDDRVLKSRAISVSTTRLAVPENHRLAKKSRIDIRELKDEPLVWLSRDNLQRYNNKLLSACVQSGLSPVIIQEVSTLSIQLSLISAGMGLGLVGSEVQSRLPANVVLRNVRGLNVSFRLVLVWRRDNESPALANFVGQFSK
jgi:DNA-binding transcriptional LysR family regulator